MVAQELPSRVHLKRFVSQFCQVDFSPNLAKESHSCKLSQGHSFQAASEKEAIIQIKELKVIIHTTAHTQNITIEAWYHADILQR